MGLDPAIGDDVHSTVVKGVEELIEVLERDFLLPSIMNAMSDTSRDGVSEIETSLEV